MAYDLHGALEHAIEIEKEGMRAYMDFALRTSSSDGKDMFIWLAREEFAHMRLFESMKAVASRSPTESLKIPESEIQRFMPRLKKMERTKGGKSDAHDADALRAALRMEIETRDFYREQSEKADDPKVKEVFKQLAEVEEGHRELIQAQLDFVTQTGFWFGMMEFDVEGRA
ncbi:MAG: ferritin family protein [candidate division WOR-3 bacterium]